MNLSFSEKQIDTFNKRKSKIWETYKTYQKFVAEVIGADPMEKVYLLPEEFNKEQKEISEKAFL